MAWRVGMKVVCVDDTGLLVPHAPRLVVKGCVYQIIGFRSNMTRPANLLLADYPNYVGGADIGWLARRFRPLVERKTDIGWAHEILRTVTKPQPVDAETMRAFDRAYAEAYPGYVPDYIERHRK
jgi:hypothetical protein